MPYRGVFPIAHHPAEFDPTTSPCVVCEQLVTAADLILDGCPDAYLHRRCLAVWLCTTEGQMLVENGRTLVIPAASERRGTAVKRLVG